MGTRAGCISGRALGLLISITSPVIASPQSQAESLNQTGVDMFKAKKYSDAAQKFRAAIELSPRWGRPYLNLCIAQFSVDNFDEALTSCRDALQRDLTYPQRVDAFRTVESIWAKKGKGAVPAKQPAVRCSTQARLGGGRARAPTALPFEDTNKDGVRAVFCAKVEEIKDPNKQVYGFDDPSLPTTPVRDSNGDLILDGPYVRFYATGEKQAEGYFSDGRESGKSIGYYRDGAVASIEEDSGNGRRDRCRTRKEFYPTGEKMSESPCDNSGTFLIHWYKDGTKKGSLSRTPFCSSVYTVIYHPNGNTESQGCGGKKRTGEWKFFDVDGHPLRIEHYVDGQLDGAFDRFENNQAVEHGTYARGLKQGQWRTWSANARLTSDDEYLDDVKLEGSAAKKARREREKLERAAAAGDQATSDAPSDKTCDVSVDGTIASLGEFFGEVEVAGQPAPVSVGAYQGRGKQVLFAVSAFASLPASTAINVVDRFARARAAQRGIGMKFTAFKVKCSAPNKLTYVISATTSR